VQPLIPLSAERRDSRAARQWEAPEKEPTGKRYRSYGQRDRDRVLYSSALQRLAYVTQVTASESGHIFHNRLSHSLKVAQVGRRNAERLQRLVAEKEIAGAAAELIEAVDPDALEASCLAHDLGHPPFGHIAEEVLHEDASEHVTDGFEGNAQSFRIATRLAVRDSNPGLNLTRQTLEGLLKYPWRHWPKDPMGGKRERKWGYYAEDEDAFRFVREHWPAEEKEQLPERAFEAELVEWADDLTYAVHDVDDFFRAGLVPLDRLAAPEDAEIRRLTELLTDQRDAEPQAFPPYDIGDLAEAARQVISLHGPGEPYRHTADARATMRDFGSTLITNYLEAFTLQNDVETGRPVLRIDDEAKLQVEALRMLVVAYVIRRPGLAVVQHGQQRVIRQLFGWYLDASVPGKGDRRVFPPGAKERLDKCDDSPSARARVVVDLISGLTETTAIQLHHRLSGGWTAPALDATALMA
jgi:dGTPase